MSTRVDRLFSQPLAAGASFQFDRDVADVFDNMANRSIPLYAATQDRTVSLLRHGVGQGGTIADVGCSTGELFHRLIAAWPQCSCTLVGIDASAPMLEQATAKVGSRATWLHTPVEEVDWAALAPAAIVANWTLQFVPPIGRVPLLAEMRRASPPDGLLILSEKLAPEPALHDWVTRDYHASKMAAGYTEEEIQNKARALDGVLIPWTLQQWMDALRHSGWGTPTLLSAWAPFATLVCRPAHP